MIDFQYIRQKNIPIEGCAEWLHSIILTEGKKPGEIIYVFCNDDYLLEKNIQFLNHDTLTDVITFDYCKKSTINGDILISIDRVKENAKIFKIDFLTELHRVMAHGLLHLLGYKDKTKEDKKIIRNKEDYYLSIK